MRSIQRKQKKILSLKSISTGLLLPACLAVIIFLICILLIFKENKKLADDYIKDTAGLYVNQINQDIAQINTELIYILERDPNISALPDILTPEMAAYYEAFHEIREQNNILSIRYQEVQFFYVYNHASDTLITNAGTIFSDSIKSSLYKKMTEVLKCQERDLTSATRWRLLSCEGKNYIMAWYTKGKNTMGCIIDASTIFEILQNTIRNYQVIPYMRDAEGSIFLSERVSEKDKKQIKEESIKGYLYTFPLGSVGQIYLYIVGNSGMLGRVLKVQIWFMLLLLILTISCAAVAYIYYEKIMAPLRDFVHTLSDTDEEQLLNDNGSNNILELEFASGKFKNLLRRIQTLKIAIYEQELKEQKAELEYVQEQLRPHFLLNCLSVIHGKADEKGENEIVKITELLSDYMRYVMKDSKNQRRIGDELAHITAYVDMQKLRYGEDAFSYEVILDGEVEECLLPPLLLQTLIENAIVHEVTLDNKIEISLYIAREMYEECPYLYISVSDTGKGFSDEALQALEQDIPIIYNGRTHVGLQNIRRRLELMYHGRASITFSNMRKNYGAVVEVRLPLQEG